MRRKRGLSEGERALWKRVISDTTPLWPSTGGEQSPDATSEKTPRREDRPAPLRPTHDRPVKIAKPQVRPLRAAVQTDFPDSAPRPVGKPEPGLDRRTADRLRRGERAPEARLDLHGMTSERAHHALNGFLARVLSQNLRCVLVITGKGGRHTSEEAAFMRPETGILRQAVPRWLRSGPYATSIVGIFEAHIRHGGQGALYVYLKKAR
ncbi:MAG: Smr/MutS family protein [Pseudomonadota bacterium]